MLLLACSNKKILSRWKTHLNHDENILEVNTMNSLRKELSKLASATVVFHSGLEGVNNNNDIHKLLKDFPKTGILILTDVPNEYEGIHFIRNGFLGYANTYIKPELLVEAIKVIQLGESWVSQRLLHWMMNHCNDTQMRNKELGSYMALDTLTPSEKQVTEHLMEGNNNKQIARKLNITERTVKAHLTSVYSKTGVKDRLHLALLMHNNRAV